MSQRPPKSKDSAEDGVGDTMVHLNVGGFRYCVGLSTLQKLPTFNEVRVQGRADWYNGREIFVDRDGFGFQHVLDFLRTGRVFADLSNDQLVSKLKAEAEFYNLHRLSSLLGTGRFCKGNVVKLKATHFDVVKPLLAIDANMLSGAFGGHLHCSPGYVPKVMMNSKMFAICMDKFGDCGRYSWDFMRCSGCDLRICHSFLADKDPGEMLNLAKTSTGIVQSVSSDGKCVSVKWNCFQGAVVSSGFEGICGSRPVRYLYLAEKKEQGSEWVTKHIPSNALLLDSE